jgi:hypothetical protein
MPSSSDPEHEPFRLDVFPEARTEWLERRVAALERQLEYRIRIAAAAEAKAEAKAREYDALMQTRTMRFLRLPRAVYARLRRFRRDRARRG